VDRDGNTVDFRVVGYFENREEWAQFNGILEPMPKRTSTEKYSKGDDFNQLAFQLVRESTEDLQPGTSASVSLQRLSRALWTDGQPGRKDRR